MPSGAKICRGVPPLPNPKLEPCGSRVSCATLIALNWVRQRLFSGTLHVVRQSIDRALLQPTLKLLGLGVREDHDT